MTKRSKKRKWRSSASALARRRHRTRLSQRKSKSGLIVKRRRRGIGHVHLQRGLIVLQKSKDIKAAAKAARSTPERFRRAALKKRAIKRKGTQWVVRRDLPRSLPLFTDGKRVVVTVSIRAARLLGQYMAAVGNFVRTNDPTFLDQFVDRSVTDTSKTKHEFETRPNVLYRLTLSESETFEQVYRIVV